MKTKFIAAGLLAAMVLTIGMIPAIAQQPEEMTPEMAEMMAKWNAIKTPGEPHKKFADVVGKWTATAKFWMDPAAPPTESQGSAEFKLILGGRYLVQEYSGDWMGETFHGMGISAFDNFRQEYVDVWMDDMGTGIFVTHGTADASGKVITSKGMMDDPMSGRKDVATRSVFTMVDKDTQKMEMFAIDASGKEVQAMEILYKRQK